MKKIFFAFTMLGCGMGASAQYKKASFLNKNGRTYELGSTGHLISKPRAFTPEFFFSYGRETEGRKFYWVDLGITAPAVFATTATDEYTSFPVPVTGRTKLGFGYGYNLGYYLIDKNNDKNKILPYLAAGLGMHISSGVTTDQDVSNTYFDSKQYAVSIGLNGGAGVLFKISEKFGVRAAGGYSYQYNPHPPKGYGEDKQYDAFVSAPYATLALRIKFNSEE